MGKHTVIRYHDFCAGHTVTGHESKCKHLHGHNYRVTFHVRAKELDTIGRVVDFSVVKSRLCEWLEEHWDHKFLISHADPRLDSLAATDVKSLVVCMFNPTAENMAEYLVEAVGPIQLKDLPVELVGVELSETRKCSVTYFKE